MYEAPKPDMPSVPDFEHDMPGDWETVEWKASGGFGSQNDDEDGQHDDDDGQRDKRLGEWWVILVFHISHKKSRRRLLVRRRLISGFASD